MKSSRVTSGVDAAYPMTLNAVARILETAVSADPDAVAVVIGDDRATFRQLRAASLQLAVELRNVGIKSGDHVAVWLTNGIEFVEAVYAAAYLGAVLVPINTWYQAPELEYVLRQSNSRALLAQRGLKSDEFVAILKQVLPQEDWTSASFNSVSSPSFPALRAVRVSGGARSKNVANTHEAAHHTVPSATYLEDEVPAYILYTSGTTGSPKGAVLTDRATVKSAELFGSRLGIGPDDRYYCPVPFFHAGGLIFVILAAHLKRGRVVSNARFVAGEALEEALSNQCTLIGGFDITYSRLVDALGHRQPPPFRAGWWATGLPTLFNKVEARLGVTLMNLYGLTEATGNVTSTPLSWTVERRANSQGIPLPGRKVLILQEDGSEAPPNTVGEICVEGWGIMQGYYDKPNDTARSIDPSGRLRTDDAGYLDRDGDLHFRDGDLHFVGRIRDALKVGGENVSPAEIEEVLLQYPGVAEVAVVGVPDNEYGEVPVAAVRRGAQDFASADLARFARERLARFKIPRHLVFVDDFPRSSTGKIQKSLVAEEMRRRFQAAGGIS